MILRKLFFLILLLLLAIGWGGLSFLGNILPGDLLSGKKNIVVMGCDIREGDRGRSDTLFVVMMEPGNKGASLLSIPRDTRVKIDGHGWDKINAAFAYGGHQLTRDTTQQLLGIKLDNYVVIDFQGLAASISMWEKGCIITTRMRIFRLICVPACSIWTVKPPCNMSGIGTKKGI